MKWKNRRIAAIVISLLFVSDILLSTMGYKETTAIAEAYRFPLGDVNVIQLHDGDSGNIDVDMDMPDMCFTPEEDGAWLLMLTAEGAGKIPIVTDFGIYEKQENGEWEQIDYVPGPALRSLEDDRWEMVRRIPQYYQAGKTYRICFDSVRYIEGEGENYQYHFTFTKTNLAGYDNGFFWRVDYREFGDLQDEEDYAVITRYVGDAIVLEIPSVVGEFPLLRIGENNITAFDNQDLQIIDAGNIPCIVSSFSLCTGLKDIYLDNKDCLLYEGLLPKHIDKITGETYYDCTIHSYSGGLVEKKCREYGYPFKSLGEEPSPNPLETVIPTPAGQPTGTNLPTDISTQKPGTPDLPTDTPTQRPEIPNLPTEAPTQRPEIPNLPTEAPTQTPEASNLTAEVPAQKPASTDSSVGISHTTVSESLDLSITTDKYTTVFLQWKGDSKASYRIYRSNKKETGYKLLKKITGKTVYQDTTVKSGKKYYYQVKLLEKANGKNVVTLTSPIVSAKIRTLKKPVVQIQKRKSGTFRYLDIYIKKYQGKTLEIYYKKKKKESYHRLALRSDDIEKQKQHFRVRYLTQRGKLYLKLRTCGKRKKKKVYSSFSQEYIIKT